MTTYGYARVSTDGQTLAAQDAQLHAAGCVVLDLCKIDRHRGIADIRPRLGQPVAGGLWRDFQAFGSGNIAQHLDEHQSGS
jgi:hypothetical protein